MVKQHSSCWVRFPMEDPDGKTLNEVDCFVTNKQNIFKDVRVQIDLQRL